MLAEGFGKHFLGLHGARKLLGTPIDAWGWKEPRTCLTLPVWRTIYPEARYVHIVRHPLDVALSLRTRQERKEREASERWSHPECAEMSRNLRLWELYDGAVRQAKLTTETRRRGEEPALELRYEDLLASPLERLREVAAFAGLTPGEAHLSKAAGTAESGRARRLKDGDPVDEWTAAIRAMPDTKRYGYE